MVPPLPALTDLGLARARLRFADEERDTHSCPLGFDRARNPRQRRARGTGRSPTAGSRSGHHPGGLSRRTDLQPLQRERRHHHHGLFLPAGDVPVLLILGLREKRIPPHAAQYVATAAALLTLGTVLLSLRAGQDATYTYLVVVVMIGLGYIVLSREILLLILVLVYTAWAVAALPVISSLDFDRLSFSLAVGAILAVAIHAGRMNQLRHQEEVLRLERQQQEALRAELVERRKVERQVRRQLDMEQLLSSIAADLVEQPASETDTGVQEGLERIGRFAGVDRSFLILLSEDRKTFDRVYDWRGKGFGPPSSELTGMPVDDLPWTVDEFSRHRLLNVATVADLPAEGAPLRKLLENFGVLSVLAVPVAYGSIFSGVIGFDMESEERLEERRRSTCFSSPARSSCAPWSASATRACSSGWPPSMLSPTYPTGPCSTTGSTRRSPSRRVRARCSHSCCSTSTTTSWSTIATVTWPATRFCVRSPSVSLRSFAAPIPWPGWAVTSSPSSSAVRAPQRACRC